MQYRADREVIGEGRVVLDHRGADSSVFFGMENVVDLQEGPGKTNPAGRGWKRESESFPGLVKGAVEPGLQA